MTGRTGTAVAIGGLAVAALVGWVVLGQGGAEDAAVDPTAIPSESAVVAASSTPATETPSGGPASEPPTASGPLDIAWSQEEWPGLVEAAYTDAASGQVLAAGAIGDDLVMWTSPDGAAWEQRDVPEPTNDVAPGEPVGTPFMRPLVRFTDTLFAFGIVAGPLDSVRPIAWRSSDGHVWEMVASDSDFYTDGYHLFDVEASDAELLAVTNGFSVPSGGTWRWSPETSWTQTTPGGVDYRQSGLWLTDAVRGPDRFVLVGGLPESRALSYVSTDGQAWEEAPAAPALNGALMHSVAIGSSGEYVSVGAQAGQAAAWVSPDGLTWEPVALPNALGAEAHGVIAVPGGYLAVGPDVNDANVTRTWTSRDGRTWLEGPLLEGHLPAQFIGRGHVATATDDEVLLFLSVGGIVDDEPVPVLWRGAIGD